MFQVPESVSNHYQGWTKVGLNTSVSEEFLSLLVIFRSQIAIPAQGLIEFRDALTGLVHSEFFTRSCDFFLPTVAQFCLFADLTEEFGSEDGGFQGELPEGRHCRW